MKNLSAKPLITVIVEGYNESVNGSIRETVETLKKQTFPAEDVELILVGSEQQEKHWREIFAGEDAFFSIDTLGNDETHYYDFKNKGAELASSEILAFTDSDVTPEPVWLENIYDGITKENADAVAGVSLFSHENDLLDSNNPIMQIAASISWGFIAPKNDDLVPNLFLAHNLGIRKDAFLRHKYRTEFGRTCAGSLLYDDLQKMKVGFKFQPKQKVAHNFTFNWWLFTLNFRNGYEVYTLRRKSKDYPNKWMKKFGLLEPFATFFWHTMLDVPQWFRYGKFMNLSIFRRVASLPLLFIMSAAARGTELVGMYSTIFKPQKMRDWAETS